MDTIRTGLGKQWLLSIGLVVASVLTASCERGLQITPDTTLEEIRSFPTEAQYAQLNANLDRQLVEIAESFAAGDRIRHAQATLALLMYTRSIPTFWLEDHYDDFVLRVGEEGVEPYLSYYIDVGRRLSFASRPTALGRYQWMCQVFEADNAMNLGSQIVFLREGSYRDSPVETFSDNVGWAAASIIFSDFGRNMGMFSVQELKFLLQLAEFAASCANCEESADGVPAGILGGREVVGSDIESIRDLFDEAGPEDACDVLNAAFALGMDETTQQKFCEATNDLKDNGFASLSKACFEQIKNAFGESLFPEQETVLEAMERFDAFVACMNREFNRQRPDEFFQDFGQYLQGVPGRMGECDRHDLPPNIEYICQHTDATGKKTLTAFDGNLNPVATKVRYSETSLLTGATITTDRTTSYADGRTGVVESITNVDGSTWTHTDINDPANNYSRSSYTFTDPTTGDDITISKITKNGQTTYVKKVNGEKVEGESQEELKKEYEKAKKKHEEQKKKSFPKKKPGRPGPDDPIGPCAEFLTRGGAPPIHETDIGTLIQFAPDEVLVSVFETILSCLENFESLRRCHMELMCIDERGEPDCECTGFGGITRENPCPYIQCAEDASPVNCMCLQEGGGVVPGLNGPLFFPPPQIDVGELFATR